MKLFMAVTSPYVRKVRMTAMEKGLSDRIEEVAADPYADPAGLQAANPLGKVPALLTDDGVALFDSRVICAYLDSLVEAPALLPSGSARWRAEAAMALTDGMLDAALGMVMETRRPEDERSSTWPGRWAAAILRGADVVEADMSPYDGPVSLPQIGLGAALGYLDFRLPDIGWRDGRPGIADWYAAFAERPAMVATAPTG